MGTDRLLSAWDLGLHRWVARTALDKSAEGRLWLRRLLDDPRLTLTLPSGCEEALRLRDLGARVVDLPVAPGVYALALATVPNEGKKPGTVRRLEAIPGYDGAAANRDASMHGGGERGAQWFRDRNCLPICPTKAIQYVFERLHARGVPVDCEGGTESAGLAAAFAVVHQLCGERHPCHDEAIAATGQVAPDGEVLRVDDIRTKIEGLRREAPFVRKAYLPRKHEADLAGLEIGDLRLRFVDHVGEALEDCCAGCCRLSNRGVLQSVEVGDLTAPGRVSGVTSPLPPRAATAVSTEQVLALLGVRGAMRDPRYFVGRDELILGMTGCVRGDQRNPVWLYGSRRIGKSSIAMRLKCIAEEAKTLTLWVDATRVPSGDFNELLNVTVDLAEQSTGMLFRGESPAARFRMLAAHSDRQPTLVIFDEFDHVVMTMCTNEQQGLLRRLSHEHDYLSYVFVTRLRPGLVVEEVPDRNSRLSGICNPDRIKPLDRDHVRELCLRVALDLGHLADHREVGTAWADNIWRVVGGLPILVMALLRRIAVRHARAGTVTEDDISEILSNEAVNLEDDIASYWWNLSPEARLVLIDDLEPGGLSTIESRLREDGFIANGRVVRPDWLVAIGRRLGPFPSCVPSSEGTGNVARIEHLHALMVLINERLQLKGYYQAFETPHDLLKYFRLARPLVDDFGMRQVVAHLFHVFVEKVRWTTHDARAHVSDPLKGLYTDALVVADLAVLHGQGVDGRPAEDSGELRVSRSVQEVLRRFCGSSSPDSCELRNRVRDALLDEIGSLLERCYWAIDNLPTA